MCLFLNHPSQKRKGTWRIIPGSKWLITMDHGDHKSPKDRVVGPLPNGRTLWLMNRGYLPLTKLT